MLGELPVELENHQEMAVVVLTSLNVWSEIAYLLKEYKLTEFSLYC